MSRDEGPQYALPLVIRVERDAPPARTDALEGAARAVLYFLTDPRVTGDDGVDGEWTAAVRAWTDARIRKVVRRARGAAWQRALALPGITVTHRTAEIRVYPPVPVDDWPPDLARLQVAGTDLDDPEPPGAVAPGTPVLWLNPELPMTTGKAMAQAGHAAQLAWWRLEPRGRSEWEDTGFELAVRPAPAGRWAELTASGLPVVRDGGFTEVAPGSCTVVADVPALVAASGRRPQDISEENHQLCKRMLSRHGVIYLSGTIRIPLHRFAQEWGHVAAASPHVHLHAFLRLHRATTAGYGRGLATWVPGALPLQFCPERCHR